MTIPAGVKWLPSLYVDEVVPLSRATPQDWIVTLPDGSHCLADGDIYANEDDAGHGLPEGAAVDFEWTYNIGPCTWTGAAWEPPLPDPPEGSSSWMFYEQGDVFLVEDVTDLAAPPCVLTIYCWSTKPVRYTLANGILIRDGATP